MIAKDLVVLGDARILGRLYTAYSSQSENTVSATSYSTRMVPAGDTASNPESEGEVVWEYE
jgi:hypothetical protein